MLIGFLLALRNGGLPVSIREFLALLDALQSGVIGPGLPDAGSMDDFYHLSRALLVKDERLYDKFDRAFAQYVEGVHTATDFGADIPAEWLRQRLDKLLTDAQRAQAPHVEWERLLDVLRERLQEQREAHAGGQRWIGTGGTSPFGHGGHNPQGVRIGGNGAQRQAVKVWERREFRDYDDQQTLDSRQWPAALRRLRRLAREGNELELDLPGTIHATAQQAGLLDLQMVPERRNHAKVLLLMDVGGSMDDHVQRMEQLFTAARSEFRHLDFFYFHNCVYERVWTQNRRRRSESIETWDLLRRYPRDHKLILVGDATMSPYEILAQGGSVEHHNAEAGAVWLQRLTQAFPRHAWLNPEPAGLWEYRQSIGLIREMVGGHMFPLTLAGLEQMTRHLSG